MVMFIVLLLKQKFQASGKHNNYNEGIISLMEGDKISLNESLATHVMITGFRFRL